MKKANTIQDYAREAAQNEAAQRRIIPPNRLENYGAQILFTLKALTRHTGL